MYNTNTFYEYAGEGDPQWMALFNRTTCAWDVTYPETNAGDVGESPGSPGCYVWVADVWQSKMPCAL